MGWGGGAELFLCPYPPKFQAGRKEGSVLFNDTLNTFLFMVIWRQTQIVREETSCLHMGYTFRLTARVLLYAPSHRQDITYHSLCYTSRGALGGTGTTCFSVTGLVLMRYCLG